MTDKGDKDKKVDLGLLEEDDEFEEFPAEGKESSSSFFLLEFPILLYLWTKVELNEAKREHLKFNTNSLKSCKCRDIC